MNILIKSLFLIIILHFTVFSQTAEEKFNQATKLFENGKHQEAITIVQTIEKQVGANPKIYSLYVNAYLADGDYVNAKIALNKFKVLVGEKTSESIKSVLDKEREIDEGLNRADKEFAQKQLAEANKIVGASEQDNKEKQNSLQNAPKYDPIAELEAWKKIKSSNNPSDFQSFLQQFPAGSFVTEAKAKLATLGDLEWNRLKNSKDVNSLRAYANNPNSRYSAEAGERLKMLTSSLIDWEKLGDNPGDVALQNYITKYPEGANLKKAKFAIIWNRVGIRRKVLDFMNFEKVHPFSDGLAQVTIGRKQTVSAFGNDNYSATIYYTGYMDRASRIVIPFQFVHRDDGHPFGTNPSHFNDGIAKVSLPTDPYKFFFIDKTGTRLNLPELGYVGTFKNGFIIGTGNSHNTNHNIYLIDSSGKVIKSFSDGKSANGNQFSEGLGLISFSGGGGKFIKAFFIDQNGKEQFRVKNDFAEEFSDGLAYVWGNQSPNGYIDKTGKLVIKNTKYKFAHRFSEGLAGVGNCNASSICQYGFIDKTAVEVIPLKYSEVRPFSNGLAQVQKIVGNKFYYGFINKTGKEVIPIKFETIWCLAFMNEGLIGVVLNGKKGFIDLEGNEYFDF